MSLQAKYPSSLIYVLPCFFWHSLATFLLTRSFRSKSGRILYFEIQDHLMPSC